MMLGFKLFNRFALIAGLSLNALTTYEDESEYGHLRVSLGNPDSWNVVGYPGVMLGVQIL